MTIAADAAGTGQATFTASASGYTCASVAPTEVAKAAPPQLQVPGNKPLIAG